MTMIKVGLTGNIGSGKSTVARLFAELGVPVFYADIEARFITDEYDVLQEIEDAFGKEVLDEYGLLDRKKLGSIVFSDTEKLKQLNSIIHPRVTSSFIEWSELLSSEPYILHESAILYESGLDYLCDKVIVVTASKEIRLQRVMLRDKLSADEVLKRMKTQWEESELKRLADFEIVNNNNSSLTEQVNKIDAILKSIVIKPDKP